MIEAALQQAVIKVESGGNPLAVSSQGAKGLMQLMDATGNEWHGILGIKEPYDPFVPEQNVKIGSEYLTWLIGKFSGDVQFALAAYNGGFGYVARKVKELDIKKFDELEPHLHKETRNYVQRVLEERDKILKA